MANRLLLVENEQSLLDLLDRYLTRSGYTVKLAPSAEYALELLAVPDVSAPGIDLAIIDLNLSDGMTGVDLLGKLRQNGFGFPVLLYSGYPFAVETLAAGLQPNVWFLQKPFVPRVLSEMVTKILGPA